MIIEVLVCRPEGTQEMLKKEVPEDWFGFASEPEAKTMEERLTELETKVAAQTQKLSTLESSALSSKI